MNATATVRWSVKSSNTTGSHTVRETAQREIKMPIFFLLGCNLGGEFKKEKSSTSLLQPVVRDHMSVARQQQQITRYCCAYIMTLCSTYTMSLFSLSFSIRVPKTRSRWETEEMRRDQLQYVQRCRPSFSQLATTTTTTTQRWPRRQLAKKSLKFHSVVVVALSSLRW